MTGLLLAVLALPLVVNARTAGHRLVLVKGWHVFHKPHWRPYRWSNSPARIALAAQRGYEGIDLDLSVDAQRHPWFNHWPALLLHDMFRRAGVKLRARIGSMSTATVAALRTPGGQRVLEFWRGLALCKAHGITACIEAKGSPVLDSATWWREVKARCDREGYDPIVMALPANRLALKAAHEAGFRTMLLARGKVPVGAWAYLSHVKRGGRVYRVVPA